MPQLPHKRRPRWATLAVAALIATLLATAGPAGAAPITAGDGNKAEADHPAPMTACLGDATADGEFEDVSEGHFFRDAINCLKHYGVTQGTTLTTFSPNDDVPRYQMALFMERAADLVGADPEKVLSALPVDDDNRDNLVTRAEMALVIAELLIQAPGNNVERNTTSGLIQLGTGDKKTTSTDFDHFADALGGISGDGVPTKVNEAISALYELGVVNGTGDGSTYTPQGNVNRGAMAAFITRALAHTNARPAGLTAQLETTKDGGVDIVVSVRNASHVPLPNRTIDAFKAAATQESKAFNADGTCSGRTSKVDGSTKCEIEGNDPVTGADGNVKLAQLGKEDVGEGLVVWIWEGSSGDKAGKDTDYFVLPIMKQPPQPATASKATISSDLALEGTADAAYGSVVTFTIQLQDDDGMDAAPPADGVEYTLDVRTKNGRLQITTSGQGDYDDFTSGYSGGVQPGKVSVDKDGSATFTVTADDLDPNNKGDRTAKYELTRTVRNKTATGTAAMVLVPGTGAITDTEVTPSTTPATYDHTKSYSGVVVFSDADQMVKAVSVSADAQQDAPASGSTGGTAITVTVLDQYGKPYAGQGILLESTLSKGDNATSLFPKRERFSGSTGEVRISHSYTGIAAVETVTAIWNGDTADTDTSGTVEPHEGEGDDSNCSDGKDNVGTGDVVAGQDVCGRATIFWVGQVTDETSESETTATDDQDIVGPADVLSHDSDSERIVIDGDAAPRTDAARTPRFLKYDSNDWFQVDGSPVSMAKFVEELSKALAAFEKAKDISTITELEPTLHWSGYVYDDSATSAWFKLTTNLTTNDPSS